MHIRLASSDVSIPVAAEILIYLILIYDLSIIKFCDGAWFAGKIAVKVPLENHFCWWKSLATAENHF